ncbi:MAG: hypothetical protein WDM85_09330 [Caulobacteraceae bacterium]
MAAIIRSIARWFLGQKRPLGIRRLRRRGARHETERPDHDRKPLARHPSLPTPPKTGRHGHYRPKSWVG